MTGDQAQRTVVGGDRPPVPASPPAGGRRRLRRPAALRGSVRQEPARAIFPLDGLRELRGNVGELSIGTPHSSHASAFAHAVQLLDRLVKAFPKIGWPTSAGARLELVRRLGTAARRRPLEPVLVRHLAGCCTPGGGVGQCRETHAEARIGRSENMLAKRGAPCLAGFVEGLLGVHPHAPSSPSAGSADGSRPCAFRGSGSGGSSASYAHRLSPRGGDAPRRRSTS